MVIYDLERVYMILLRAVSTVSLFSSPTVCLPSGLPADKGINIHVFFLLRSLGRACARLVLIVKSFGLTSKLCVDPVCYADGAGVVC